MLNFEVDEKLARIQWEEVREARSSLKRKTYVASLELGWNVYMSGLGLGLLGRVHRVQEINWTQPVPNKETLVRSLNFILRAANSSFF